MTRLTRPSLILLSVVVAAALLAGGEPRVAAQAGAATVLKLATMAPDGSVWHQALKQFGSDARKVTGGRVAVNVFAGTQGDEPTIVRKMRLNQLQAGSLSILGLVTIEDGFNALGIPLFFESYDELVYVMDRMTPTFRSRLDAKGFVFLGWGHGGSTLVFSRTPLKTLAQLKQARLYTTAGDDRVVQWYKSSGYRPQPLAPTDMLTGLQTGLIDAVPVPALAALAFQWYKQAPYMLDVNLGPLVGATIVTRRAWDRLSEPDRQALIDLAQAMDKRLRVDVPRQDEQAVAEMAKRGLTVVRLSAAETAALEGEARRFSDGMRTWEGLSSFVDEAVRERDAFRQKKKK